MLSSCRFNGNLNVEQGEVNLSMFRVEISTNLSDVKEISEEGLRSISGFFPRNLFRICDRDHPIRLRSNISSPLERGRKGRSFFFPSSLLPSFPLSFTFTFSSFILLLLFPRSRSKDSRVGSAFIDSSVHIGSEFAIPR